ncbi:type II toxin-antitoxin system Phd/YefM family antitoxin [uncultured Dialister sp.]|nr:type II toxin-antitoxin system Phd/YefM family antitoxin [uncultured Dialister sp.]
MIPMTEANRNFSKVARMVDEKGAAVIMKNNRPRYLILNFDTLEDGTAGDEEVEAISKKLMQQNRTAYEVLAK